MTSRWTENPEEPLRPVCPRCGTTAGGSTWCSGCGLNLDRQGELPTAEAHEASVREREWLAAQGHEPDRPARENRTKDTKPGSLPAPSPSTEQATPSESTPRRKGLVLAAVLGVVTLAAGGGVALYATASDEPTASAEANSSPDRDGDGLRNEQDAEPDVSAGPINTSPTTTTAPSTDSSDAQPNGREAIAGEWTGEGSYEDGDKTDISLIINSMEGVNDGDGRLESGSCGGYLTSTYDGEEASTFDQTETDNPDGCADETEIAVTLEDDGTLGYLETWGTGSDEKEIRATLNFEGCAPDSSSEC